MKRDFTPAVALGSHGMDFPAEKLFGQKGTILAKFQQNQPASAERANRAIFTLRCHSRLQFGLAYIPNNSRKFLFHFGDQDAQFYHELPDEFDFGHDYTAAITWDGALVRLYLDGRLLVESPQPVPVEKLDALHLGPYRDDWIAVNPWADDTLFQQLLCFDEALSPAEIATLSGSTPTPSWQEYQTQLVIPIQDSDAIDWSCAASLPELVSLNSRAPGFTSPDGRFLLAATPDALHFSFEYVIPAGNTVAVGQPRTAESEPEVWGSESFEFYVNHADHNYRFAGNVAGGYAENRDNDAEWNGAWTYESHLEMQIDNSQRWRGEAAIPWSTLDTASNPENMECCLARTWCLPDYTAATVLYGNPAEDSYNQPSRYAKVRFAYGAPVVQQISRENPERGEFRQKMRFASPQDATVEYQVDLLREDGLAQPLPLYRRTLDLQANTPVEIAVTARIPSDTYDLLRYRLIDLTSHSPLASDLSPLTSNLTPLTSNLSPSTSPRSPLLQCLAPFTLNQVPIELKPHYLSCSIDVIVQPALLQKLSGGATEFELVLTMPNGTELLRQPLDGETMSLPFDPHSPAGKYTVTIFTASGKEITAAALDYPGLGEWNTAEFPTDIVLPPFTPLEYDKTTSRLSMWGRAYDYGGGPLPTQITTQEQECFLASPQLIANGVPLEVATSFSFPIKQKRNATHAEMGGATRFSDGSVLSTSELFIEYDGVAYHRLRLNAESDLQDITLRFTLAPEIAKYLHASVNTTWGSKLTRVVPEGHSEYQFYPMFWIGMEDKGLCFFTEHHNGWTGDSNAVFTIDRSAEQAILEIHLRKTLAKGEAFDFELGICATPVKPPHPLAPLVIRGDEYVAPMSRPGHLPVVHSSEYRVPYPHDIDCPFADLPALGRSPADATYREALKQRDAAGNYAVVYLDSRCLSDQYPEIAAFREEWQNTPRVALDYLSEGAKYQVFTCCPTTGANAFFQLKLKELLKRFDFDGVYFDFALMDVCNNHRHGCNEHWPILATREFYRRVALLLHQLGKPEPIIQLHNTDAVQLPAMNFATMLFNGEHIRQASTPMLHNGRDLLDNYGIEMFATELSSLPFGLTNAVYLPADVLLPENGGGKEKPELYVFRMTQAGLAGTLPHNTMLAQDRVHYGLLDKVFRIYEAFGVPQAQFHGYWTKPVAVTDAHGIYISCYTAEDRSRVLAVISHIAKDHDDQEFSVTFDWPKLGITTALPHANERLTSPDPEYQELYQIRAEKQVDARRAPLDLGDFGCEILGWDGNTLRLSLKHHCFAIVELTP
ncbi:MAG: hypothetical protein J5654_06580 [Victivallales bacterium]|nr:hypothetical protein [Victivallales bacterium]